MPKGKVTVPSTLSGHAAEIYSSAFTSAYEGTCKSRENRDECAAKIAWSAVKKKYKKKDDTWVAKASDPTIGPISTDIDNQPPMVYDKKVLKPGGGTKMQRWIAAYNKALAEDCRNSDNPTECARAYANKAVGRVETDVEPIEKVLKSNGKVIKRMVERGGPRSGHHGHRGRPGEVGGSLPSGAAGAGIKFITDPGHGWLRVPRELIEGEEYSGYSYFNDTYAYLEEDSDAPLFLKRHPEIDMEFIETQYFDSREEFYDEVHNRRYRRDEGDPTEGDRGYDRDEQEYSRRYGDVSGPAEVGALPLSVIDIPDPPEFMERRFVGKPWPEVLKDELVLDVSRRGSASGPPIPDVLHWQDFMVKIGPRMESDLWDALPDRYTGAEAVEWQPFLNLLESKGWHQYSGGVKESRDQYWAQFSYDPLDPTGELTVKRHGRVDGAKYPFFRIRGGPGSGHHGHKGRPGEVGGSLPSGAAGGGSAENPVIDSETGFRKADQVEVTFTKQGVKFREVRYKGDETARWINRERAVQLIGELNLANKLRALKIPPVDEQIDTEATLDELEQGEEFERQREQFYEENPEEWGEILEEDEGLVYKPTAQEKKMDGRRRHKFLTKAIENKLPPLYSTENDPDPMVYVKWFHPYSTQEWYATEYDPKQGLFFGWVNSEFPELGYMSRQEMAEVEVRGIPLERDLYFEPKPLSEVKAEAKRQIPPEEYNFRLESTTLRGEVDMDEHPLKERREPSTEKREAITIANCEDVTAVLRSLGSTIEPRSEVVAHIRKRAKALKCKMTPALKERMAFLEGYAERAEVRERLNDVDYQLIEQMGDQEIIRPDRFSSLTWRTMPPSQKSVRAEATRRIIERNYAQAVEDAQIAGWKAKKDRFQPDEYTFVKPHKTEQGQVIMRAVLVRNEDSVDWELKTLSQFATSSTAIQLPKGVLRHNKEQLLKIPVLRGGPGSGHYGHSGRPGEVGGSLPRSGSAGRRRDDAPAESYKKPEPALGYKICPTCDGEGTVPTQAAEEGYWADDILELTCPECKGDPCC